MNKFDALFKLIVPALFLLFWALGQVLNKEVRPAPRPPVEPGRDPKPLWPPPPPANRPEEIVILDRPARPAAGTARPGLQERGRRTTPRKPAPASTTPPRTEPSRPRPPLEALDGASARREHARARVPPSPARRTRSRRRCARP